MFNKTEMIEAMVASERNLTKAAAGRLYDLIFSSIKESVREEGSATIQGFGTFTKHATAARTGRNPITGEELQIPAGERVAFKASRVFKDLLNE